MKALEPIRAQLENLLYLDDLAQRLGNIGPDRETLRPLFVTAERVAGIIARLERSGIHPTEAQYKELEKLTGDLERTYYGLYTEAGFDQLHAAVQLELERDFPDSTLPDGPCTYTAEATRTYCGAHEETPNLSPDPAHRDALRDLIAQRTAEAETVAQRTIRSVSLLARNLTAEHRNTGPRREHRCDIAAPVSALVRCHHTGPAPPETGKPATKRLNRPINDLPRGGVLTG